MSTNTEAGDTSLSARRDDMARSRTVSETDDMTPLMRRSTVTFQATPRPPTRFVSANHKGPN